MNATVRFDGQHQEPFKDTASLTIQVGPHFPLGTIDVYTGEDMRKFSHQRITNGKLCLQPDETSVADHRRLAQYLDWAIEWLEHQSLESRVPMEKYEIPDFGAVSNVRVLFSEDEKTLAAWSTHSAGYGRLDVEEFHDGLFLVRSFLDQSGTVIRESFPSFHLPGAKQFAGVWILLPAEPVVEARRPPRTCGELRQVIHEAGLDFQEMLRAMKTHFLRSPGSVFVALGFRIPPLRPTEVHWQFMEFDRLVNELQKGVDGWRRDKAIEGILTRGSLAADRKLSFAASDNVSKTRIFARSGKTVPLLEKTIAIFGYGALGSHLAEYAVRSGAGNVHLIDNQILEPGNLVRHTLSLFDVGTAKAIGGAEKLANTVPATRVSGHEIHVPPDTKDLDTLCKIASEADTWIDATANPHATLWLADLSKKLGKRYFAVSIGWAAGHIAILDSGSPPDMMAAIRDRETQRRSTEPQIKEYFLPPEAHDEIREGVGCWHTTFPAKEWEIALCSSIAFGVIEHRILLSDAAPAFLLFARENARNIQQIYPKVDADSL